MDTDRLARKRGSANNATLLIFILLVGLAGTATPAFPQEEDIDVSCYKGNAEEGNSIGNLTVTDPANAGQMCNTTYYDCDGKCLGCIIDKDGQEVCYDNNGNKLPK